MDAAAVLREIAFWLDRAQADPHRTKAYRRAADAIELLSDDELTRHIALGFQDLPGGGASTGQVIAAVHRGEVPATLAQLRAEGATPLATGGAELRRQQ